MHFRNVHVPLCDVDGCIVIGASLSKPQTSELVELSHVYVCITCSGTCSNSLIIIF